MGVVFQARHIFLKTAHAIKIILPDLVGNDPMLVTRFRQEALAAAAIRHPNIISVTDFGVVRSTMPFLVMEFVKGKSLQEIMADEGAMPTARAYELICPTAAGVAAAHRQNIVHRDLKPLNIMIQDNMPVSEGLKILDFGLAKIKSGELLGSFVQAKTSGLMGSPFYMAPEQWSDEEPDARADIYSLGIILYQMLAGDVPFKGSSIPSIMKKHLTLPVPTFSSVGVQVPPQIEAVVRHALEKEVGARISTVEAFLDELRAAVNSASSTLKSTAERNTPVDPSKTFVSPSGPYDTQPPGGTGSAGLQTNYDPLAGTISAAALDAQVQEQLNATGEAFRREQEDKQRFAREELAREADQRQRVSEEASRKQREEDEQEKKALRQSETMARVAKQAEELEERLARLSVSMPPPSTSRIDPDLTQVHQQTVTSPGADTAFGGRTQVGWEQSVAAVPAKKSSAGLIIGVVLGVVLLGGGGVGGYLYLRSKPVVKPGPDSTPTPAVAIKADLAEIPGGTFQMGRLGATVAEEPVHPVTLKPFAIDRTEVTNAEYAQFVSETQHASPSNWAGNKPIAGDELLPVTFVSHDDTTAFAEWRSKRDGVEYRLPTEEEWEYAARGGDQDRIYPWGNDWDEGNAVVMLTVTKPKAVGSAPNDKTRWGVMDMMGNVYEWTGSKATYYPGSPGKVEGESRSFYVVRGASYATDQKLKPISATRRDWFSGTTRVAVLGFRLVREGGH
jgi:formylglycine-generating enzyme required for sulfatase activity